VYFETTEDSLESRGVWIDPASCRGISRTSADCPITRRVRKKEETHSLFELVFGERSRVDDSLVRLNRLEILHSSPNDWSREKLDARSGFAAGRRRGGGFRLERKLTKRRGCGVGRAVVNRSWSGSVDHLRDEGRGL